MDEDEKQIRRIAVRKQLGVAPHHILVGFSGKFIPKKDPLLLVEAISSLQGKYADRYSVVFLGEGELGTQLKQTAGRLLTGTVAFPGFVNQSEIVNYYLAMDIFVLPSRRRGETWGIVVNEALHAGCAVALSSAVGCGADFIGWERVRDFPAEDAQRLAEAIEDLSRYKRDFSWSQEKIEHYSVQAVARALASGTQE